MAHLTQTCKYMDTHMYRWPAMVEEDPDEETYYEMGDQNSNSVPVSPVELL